MGVLLGRFGICGGIGIWKALRFTDTPYLFTYRLAGSTTEYQVYLAFDSDDKRVLKRVDANDQPLASKTYFSMGKEIREVSQSATMEFYTLASVGRVRYSANKPNGEKEFYLLDHLGTTLAAYSFEKGEVDFASHYFPFGKQFGGLKSVDDVTEKFTGKEHDQGGARLLRGQVLRSRFGIMPNPN